MSPAQRPSGSVTPRRPDGIPPATPAASDLVCWLHAAYPARDDGWLPTSQIAADLDVSPRTVRRWAQDAGKVPAHQHRTYLARRAILRGKGTYLWPELDRSSRFRQDEQGSFHARCAGLVDAGEILPAWTEAGHITPYWVALAWYPRAHAYTVSIGRTKKALSRIEYRAEVLRVITAPSMFHAAAIKAATLDQHPDRRCIAPRELIPTGRTEALLAGPTPRFRRKIDTHPERTAR